MDFMGIGPFELILILILAFLFFGPEKLPGMAAKAGRWYRNFRKATLDLSKTISEEISNEIEKEPKTLYTPESNTKVNPANNQATTPATKSDKNPNE